MYNDMETVEKKSFLRTILYEFIAGKCNVSVTAHNCSLLT